MKLIINKSQLNIQPERFLRQAGYGFIIDRAADSESFVRRLGRGHYPRFHIYLKQKNNQIIFNLHLDQKRPSYAGASAHNAEYEGRIVEDEIERLKKLFKSVK